MALIGVSALAAELKIGKGTVSKQAASGKIPVADRDAKGSPLFDIDAVRAARANNLNPLMRREVPESEGEGPSGPIDGEASAERRSLGPRPPSALVEQQKLEKQLKNRRLLRQIAEDEGLTVLKSVVELEQTTMARRTRDAVTNFMADKASQAYAFAGTPRTEADWRVWLAERTREGFNSHEATLALENDDEFGDESAVDDDQLAGEVAPAGGS